MAQRTATYLLGTPNGCVNKNDIVVSAAIASGETNGLKKADFRFDDGGTERTLFGVLTTGSEIEIYVYPFPGDTTTKHLETTVSIASDSWVADTMTFSEVLNGPFWAIEGVKIGDSGEATLVAYL